MVAILYPTLTLLSVVSALPSFGRRWPPPSPAWIPAALIPNASRSPCPLLNTLANQGFISRDGRNLSANDITSGIVNATNIDPGFVLGFTQSRFAAIGVPTDGTISLADLNAHGITEHDASLTRLDAGQGQTLTVQPRLVLDLITDIAAGGAAIQDGVTANSLGRTRARREKQSQAAGSPPLPDGFESLALGEAGLVLLLLGKGDVANPDSISAPSWQVTEWFTLEKFPEGWTKSPTVLSVADDLNPIVGRIAFWQQQWTGKV